MARTRKHSRKGFRMPHAHRKGSRYAHRKQRGGDGFGYTGAAFDAAGGMAPVESRVAFSHCDAPARPGSLVGGARRKGRRTARAQRGGACNSCSAPAQLYAQSQQVGGGSGGYGFQLSNELGKVYPALTVGACPGAQTGGASMADARVIDSYPAGYGYGPESVREINSGTAHYLDQISYGRQCMGGGARRRRNRKGSRKAHRKAHRKSHKGRK
jgi:hypothetical protein